MTASRPLANFPLVRTHKPTDVQDALARVYARPKLELARGTKSLNAVMNECRFQNSWLAYGAYGAAVRVRFPAVNYFLQLIPIRGKGEIVSGKTSIVLTAGSGATISPDAGYRAAYDAQYECLILKIDAEALTRKLAAMTGTAIGEPLRMEPETDFAQPAARMLREYLPLLVEKLTAAIPPFPDWWMAQTEQLLMAMFLCGNRHNYSHLLEQDAPSAAPWQVRRAEEYIESHWQKPITLEELADVTGVSAFSLFRAFKISRGYSPLEFASRLRSKRGGTP